MLRHLGFFGDQPGLGMDTPFVGQTVYYYPTMVERSGYPGDRPYAAMVADTKKPLDRKPTVTLHVFHPNGEKLVLADIVFAMGEEVPTAGQAGVIM